MRTCKDNHRHSGMLLAGMTGSGSSQKVLCLKSSMRMGYPLKSVTSRIFEAVTHPEDARPSRFLLDDSHVFIALAVIFLGLNLGLSNLNAKTYLDTLREATMPRFTLLAVKFSRSYPA